MKTRIHLLLTSLLASGVLGLALTVPAADAMKPRKGGEHLLMLQGGGTQQEADALKSGDSLAPVCAKCKTVWVARVKSGVKGAPLFTEKGQPTELIRTHACKGCRSRLTVAGHAKGDVTVLQHTCRTCGDDSAFCCATKPGSGSTKGMEEDASNSQRLRGGAETDWINRIRRIVPSLAVLSHSAANCGLPGRVGFGI